jgi:hypothetical protein
MPVWKRIPLAIFILAVVVSVAAAAAAPTSPKQQFGFAVGDDYQLINYTKLVAYWKKLDQESDRLSLVDIGRSAEGRPIVMAIITSPRNMRKLDEYKSIARRLALAQGLTETEARRLAELGKAVVWIDGGLHATEIVGSQALIELTWQMVSGSDAETLRILDDVILLACPVNPDGLELVADWYMREPDPLKRSMSSVPRLYQKYIGHDNNRDFYMVTQPETEAVSRQLYIEWHPQFLYNHHQTGPAGTVLFCPPFRDPFNYDFDPLVPLGTDLLGLAMHERFAAEGKPGAIMRSGAGYSTWWNGGLRSTGYFHNIIGILTEIIGNPTPMDIPFIPDRVLPKGDYPYPVMPQKWHFRSSIDYSITADKAILDFAARRREELLWNRYVMGRNAIDKGSRDNWTFKPRDVADIQAQADKERVQSAAQSRAAGAGTGAAAAGGQRGGGAPLKFYDALRDPSKRDPRGFIIPADQPDFPTAVKFVNTLIKSGIAVHRATRPFTAEGKTYAQGSYVVKAAQAFRAHLMSMFEPQDHPNDFAYPGGPPRPPYDSAGWTVAFQMGIRFDRILDAFDGPFAEVKGFAQPPTQTMAAGAAPAAGFLLDHRYNDAAIVTNRLLKAGADVFWTRAAVTANGRNYPAGTIYIPAKPAVPPILERAARELGLAFDALDLKPNVATFKLRPVRIGLWDVYGGSMDSGWLRWLLERYEFPFELVFAQALDAGELAAKYDVLVFPAGAIPPPPQSDRPARGGFGGATPADIPPEFQAMVGRVTAEKTIPQLKKFLEDGGTILAISGSTTLAAHLGLPIADHLLEKTADGKEVPLSNQKYYVPGSILRVSVDNAQPLAFGMPEQVDVFFDNSPVFDLLPEAQMKGLKPVLWFESGNPLRSGWVWGEQYLRRGVEAIEAPYGKGKLFLFGPEIVFRGQPHGTFKLLFNGIFYGSAKEAVLN